MSRSNVKAILSIASVLVLAPFAVNGAAERPTVVTVRVWTGGETPERATGFVVGRDRVVTVAHVLDGATRVEVWCTCRGFPDADTKPRLVAVHGGAADPGGEPRHAATIVRRDRALDLALLNVPGATGPPVRFGESDGDLRVARTRGALPADARRRINARLVDQPGRPRRPSLELAASVESGDSGAPVLNTDGEVVGVVYARSTRRDGTAYAVRMPAQW